MVEQAPITLTPDNPYVTGLHAFQEKNGISLEEALMQAINSCESIQGEEHIPFYRAAYELLHEQELNKLQK